MNLIFSSKSGPPKGNNSLGGPHFGVTLGEFFGSRVTWGSDPTKVLNKVHPLNRGLAPRGSCQGAE
jgi:hypothetical protein